MSSDHQNTPADSDLWALWKSAVSLDQGRYIYGNQDLVREHNELLDSKPGAFSALGSFANVMADMTDGDAPIDPEIRTTPEERAQLSKLAQAIDEGCIKRLKARSLVALGFSIPRHPDDPPRLVPREILVRGRIRFEKNKASGDGLEFQSIRIFPASKISAEASNQTHSARPGRPSKRELIKQIYSECCAQGLIDFSKSQKTAIEVVRENIKAAHPSEYGVGKGFGNEVIRACIAEDFGTRAKNQKL